MGDDERNAYLSAILTEWMNVYTLSLKFRVAFLDAQGQVDDGDEIHEYISRLTRLIGELKPHIDGRSDLGPQLASLPADFENIEKYYDDMNLLQKEDGSWNVTEIYRIEKILRKALQAIPGMR